jgi:hypothetical protein
MDIAVDPRGGHARFPKLSFLAAMARRASNVPPTGRKCKGRSSMADWRSGTGEGDRSTKSRHAPHMRGIQYAAAYRFHRWRLWNTGSSAFAHDDGGECETSLRAKRSNPFFLFVAAWIASSLRSSQ